MLLYPLSRIYVGLINQMINEIIIQEELDVVQRSRIRIGGMPRARVCGEVESSWADIFSQNGRPKPSIAVIELMRISLTAIVRFCEIQKEGKKIISRSRLDLK